MFPLPLLLALLQLFSWQIVSRFFFLLFSLLFFSFHFLSLSFFVYSLAGDFFRHPLFALLRLSLFLLARRLACDGHLAIALSAIFFSHFQITGVQSTRSLSITYCFIVSCFFFMSIDIFFLSSASVRHPSCLSAQLPVSVVSLVASLFSFSHRLSSTSKRVLTSSRCDHMIDVSSVINYSKLNLVSYTSYDSPSVMFYCI